MTPDDKRELEQAGNDIVTRHTIITAAHLHATGDWAYWHLLRELGMPRWLAAAALITRR